MTQTVVTLGAHVLDVQVRPVEEIPAGQGATLVEQIRFGPAGTAAGTAVTLAKLGATVRTAGAIGTDPIGDLLLALLARHGVDTTLLLRRDEVQTSASVLPIRPDGSRPAFHVPGANLTYGPDDAPPAELAQATHLHLGGPELMGGESAAKILAPARAAGVVTSADLLAPGDPGILEWLAPALPHLDYLLPNDEQLLGLTGTGPGLTDRPGPDSGLSLPGRLDPAAGSGVSGPRDPAAGAGVSGRLDSAAGSGVPGRLDPEAGAVAQAARAVLDRGVGCVVVTRGARGALVVTADETIAVPAFDVAVVDTTGCGDAFSAGFLRGIALGRTPRDAAILGCAAAALVAQGLGSDHGDFDLAAADAVAASTPTLD